MSEALSALQLLAAMYPLPDELVFDSASQSALDTEDDTADVYNVVVRAPIDDEEDPRRIELSVAIPVSGQTRIAPRQPDFLTRSAFEQLLADMPGPVEAPTDYIMTVIEYIRATASVSAACDASKLMDQSLILEEPEVVVAPTPVRDEGPLCRCWFWLPSLDSKDKTREIVTYTFEYGLTGFVLAGKPGLICVEGGGKDIDRYMSKVKSESWGDVPSFQKKVCFEGSLVSVSSTNLKQVTERLRSPITTRAFSEMKDITSIITHYGRFSHRGDMGEVKKLMDEWGVGGDFGAAVMGSHN